MFCLECGIDKGANAFSEEMHVYQPGYLQCSKCVEEDGVEKPKVSCYRPCASCQVLKPHNLYSHKQLKSSKGSTCVVCMGQATCSRCMMQLPLERFSKSQLAKGFRLRRCKDCCTPPPAPSVKASKNKKKQTP